MKRIMLSVLLFIGIIVFIILSLWKDYLIEFFENRTGEITIASNIKPQFTINTEKKILSTPLLVDNVLIIQTENEIIAFDINKKNNLWSTSYISFIGNSPIYYTNEKIIVPSKNGIILLNYRDGSIIWTKNIENNHLVIEDIKSTDDFIFVVTHNGWLYKFDIIDGALLWQSQVEDRSHINIIIENDNLLLDSSSFVISYDIYSGNINWKVFAEWDYIKYDGEENIIYASDNSNNESRLDILNNGNGRVIESYPIEVTNVNCLLKDDEKLLISGNGISIVNEETYQPIWTNYEIDNLSCPIIINNSIFIRKRIRDLYQFNLQSGDIINLIPLNWDLGVSSRYSIDPIKYENGIFIVKKTNQINYYLQSQIK